MGEQSVVIMLVAVKVDTKDKVRTVVSGVVLRDTVLMNIPSSVGFGGHSWLEVACYVSLKNTQNIPEDNVDIETGVHVT